MQSGLILFSCLKFTLIFVHLLNIALVGRYLHFFIFGNGIIMYEFFCFVIALVQDIGLLGPIR